MRRIIRFSVCLLAIVLLVKGDVYLKDEGALVMPQVNLGESGEAILRGKIELSRDKKPYSAFVGIKYAKVQERFAEAVLSESDWNGVEEAVDRGAMCIQVAFPPRADGKLSNGEEDCLHLNVYVPVIANGENKGRLPVMVWIHGGGYVFGDGYQYRPQYFMDEEVILVTINYRLGVFGFLSTGDEVAPGNLGLKDMVLALKWVQKNIKNFGGDPGKVTIFGNSAGGAAAQYLLLSERTHGLFHRVISQSGSALNNWAYHPTPKDTAIELATYMKCSTASGNPSKITSSEIFSCFKSASMDELSKAEIFFRTEKVWPRGTFAMHFGPVAEPKSSPNPFLTQSPFAIMNGNEPLKDIPWVIGVVEDEGAIFASMTLGNEDNLVDLDENFYKIAPKAFNFYNMVPAEQHMFVSKKIREFYFGYEPVSPKTRKALVDIYSDYMFMYGIYKNVMETIRREKRGNVYLYQFTQKSPKVPFDTIPMHEDEAKLVTHGEELMNLFDMAEDGGAKNGDEFDAFSRNMIKLWVSIAKNGKPTHSWGSSMDKWELLSNGSKPKFYRLDQNPRYVQDPYSKRMAFWDKLYEVHYEQILMGGDGKGRPNRKTEL